ncbi:MAG: WD40 repeat domain-containing protein, partial [Myxococcota bacterium]
MIRRDLSIGWSVAMSVLACSAPPPPALAPPTTVDTDVAIAPAPEPAKVAYTSLLLGARGASATPAPRPTGPAVLSPSGTVAYLEEGQVAVWSKTATAPRRIALRGEDWRLVGAPADDRLVLAQGGRIELWSLAGEGRRLASWRIGTDEEAKRLGAYRERIMATSTPGAFAVVEKERIRIFRAEDGGAIGEVAQPGAWGLTYTLADRGRALLGHGYKEGLKLWKVGTPEPLFSLPPNEDHYLKASAVSLDGKEIAYVRPATDRRYPYRDELVWLEVGGREIQRWIVEQYRDLGALTLTPSRIIASDERMRSLSGLHIYPRTGGEPHDVAGEQSVARDDAIWIRYPSRLVRCASDTLACPGEDAHWGPVRSLQVVGDGRRVVSAGSDGRVLVWRLDGHQASASLVVASTGLGGPMVASSRFGVAILGDLPPGDAKRTQAAGDGDP